jgi:hypothetical protein
MPMDTRYDADDNRYAHERERKGIPGLVRRAGAVAFL